MSLFSAAFVRILLNLSHFFAVASFYMGNNYFGGRCLFTIKITSGLENCLSDIQSLFNTFLFSRINFLPFTNVGIGLLAHFSHTAHQNRSAKGDVFTACTLQSIVTPWQLHPARSALLGVSVEVNLV